MSTTCCVEDVPDPVADDVVDRLHLELAGERVLDAVDQRQLRVPLPRLVHEPRVLERHAQAAGQRLAGAAGRTRRRRAPGRCSGARSRRRLCRRRRAARTAPDFGISPANTRLPYSRPRPQGSRRSAVAHGSRVRACGSPTSAVGSSGSRSPRSIAYGKCMSPSASSYMAMSTTCASKTSRILSPTAS